MITRLTFLFSKLFGLLGYLPRTIGLLGESAGRWTMAWAVLLLGQGALPAVSIHFTKSLVDALAAAMGGRGDWRPALLYAGIVGTTMLLLELLRGGAHFVRAGQAELLKDHISELIQQKSASVDYAFYEMPEYHDRLHRAQSEAGYRPVALIESLGNLLRDGVTLGALLVVLLPFGAWLPLALLAATLPSMAVVLTFTLRRYEWQHRITEAERRAWYYDWVLTAGETAAEVRLFRLGDYFRNAYRQVRRTLRGEQLQLAKAQGLAEFAASLLALLIVGGVLGWMGWRGLRGLVTLGTLALFYQAFSQGQQALRSLLGSFGEFYSNGLFLSDLFEFLDLQPTVAEPASPVTVSVSEPLKTGIEFDRVTFRYPGSERAALESFSLAVPAGRIVAIVGLNGAGKTTLIKLLCRLYDPEAGRIRIDGVDLRQMAIESLRRRITVLFQQPVHFNATVAENIRFGAVGEEISGEQARKAAEDAGAAAVIDRLPEGEDTHLGKWFSNGAELSTGEWQRLALARAFVRQAPIVLLDEPTSAMDSWAETDWLRRFRLAMAGRTVIIITHRFTSAMQADRIHVMEAGRIVESGTHGELLALGGRYAQSWAEQLKGPTP